MLSKDRLRTRILYGCALVLFTVGSGWFMPELSVANEVPNIISRGRGPAEVLIFTDYFCPPCQGVEPYLEKALADLYRSGVKVTFVDKPIHAKTPLFSRYFLYAANSADSFAEVLHIRSVLFDIAKSKSVETEGELIGKLKANGIKLGLFDVRPVFGTWLELIQRFEVKSTPTCIVMRPGQAHSTLTGSGAIPEGIDRLLKELNGGS